MTDRISVVVLNWNQTRETRACVDRLLAFRSLRSEIWVVDNASREVSTSNLGGDSPDVHVLLSESNLGFGGAINLAVGQTNSPFVMLLNNDAFILEEPLTELLEALEAEPSLAAIGPALCEPDDPQTVISVGGRDITKFGRTHLRPSDFPVGSLDNGKCVDVDYLPGAVVLLRTAAFERFGPLEESYFFGGELADFAETARAGGQRVAVLPQARGWHDLASSAPMRRRLYPYYALRNRVLFIRRHRQSSRARLTARWTAYSLALIARELLRLDFARARLLNMALRDGLAGRFGNQNDRVLRVDRSAT